MNLKISVILALTIITNIANSQTLTPPSISEALNAPRLKTPPPAFPVEKHEPEITQVETDITTDSNENNNEFIALPTESAFSDDVKIGSNSNNLITINLEDVTLKDVVSMVGFLSNANIISSPTNLTAHITANLENVEWKPALSSILSLHNFALKETPLGSEIYTIVEKGTNTPDPLIVETIFLEYTTVAEVSPVIEKMLTAGRGGLSIFTSRNALVIRSTEDNLAEIKLVLKDIDIQSKQVCVEALFMELSDSAIKQLGIRWDSLGEFGVEAGLGPFASSETITREQSRIDSLTQGDERSSLDENDRQYDMYGTPFGTDPTRRITDSIDLTREASSAVEDRFIKIINESKAAILNVDSMKVVLSALKKTDGISVVSNPKIIVANGATNAFFRVGSREPIIKTSVEKGTQDSPGDTVTTELDMSISTDFIDGGYAKTGIELKVVPTVKADNLIEALIEPSLRRKIDEKITRDPDTGIIIASYPVITVKEIKTRFTLESGQTVAIGGLTDTTEEKVTSKIPLLGDIPLIGKYLFSHTKDVKKQVETIIFVTLSIADPKNLAASVAIPDRARLVHKRIIQGRVDKHAFDAEIEKLSQAADKKMKREDKKNSSNNSE